ncbi:GTPase HflX, partial [Lactobacillus sp. XV13L]|nr:GTPase HflX [Lactobacillus sp. XV13L]
MEENNQVIIAGVSHLQEDFDYSMNELAQLVNANNQEVAAQVRQNIDQINGKTYFGSGKVQEIKQLAQYHNVTLIIVNDELTPAQVRNLEKATQLHFLDRTELILQVFAQRAHSRQAQLQVAIAQLQYQLPRIHPSGNPLDQQRGQGGLANRGAGESQLELNRRTIRQRITKLKQELQHVEKTLTTQSTRRQNSRLPKVALVGYTNAGKSTTLNGILDLITDHDSKKVFVKDQLFATLDTSIRKITLPQQPSFLLSDT